MTYGFDTTTDEVIEGVDLSGKLAIVTGSSTGIGEETARALAAAGAHVVLAARNRERTEEVAASIGGRWVDLREVRAAGDEIFVAMTWRVDRSSDSAVLGDVFHLVALAGGRISRIRVFLTEEDALAAAAG